MPTDSNTVIVLNHGSDRHTKLKNYLCDNISQCETNLSTYYDSLRRREEQFRLYVEKPSDENGGRNSINPSKTQKKRPSYETILVPYGYANAATAHTYMTSVFMSRNPIFQFSGLSGETQMQEMAMEAIAAYQLNAGDWRPALFHWLYDPFRWGLGILGNYWERDIFPSSQIVMTPDPLFPTDRSKDRKQTITTQELGYQGCKIYNVRPYDFLRDTRFGMAEFQKGAFAGERNFIAWHTLEEWRIRGLLSERNYQVLKYFQQNEDERQKGSDRFDQITDSDKQQPFRFKDGTDRSGVNVVDVIFKIVPKYFGLSSSEVPEKWNFVIAENEVVLYARPIGNKHNQFPYNILQYEIDQFLQYPEGLLTLTEPMERAMTWLLNMHFYNVRKHLNNNLVVDPSRVVLKDFYQRKPGGLIRTKPSAYGQNVQDAVWQVPVGDVTRNHIGDMRAIEELGMKMTGINDNVMGLVNPGGRKTATEIRASSSFGTNRLKTVAEWFSATGFRSLGRHMVMNSQQYLEGEQVVKITGDMLKKPGALEDFLRVTKEDISGNYDFEVIDGSLPVDRMAQVNVMREMLTMIAQSETMMQEFDIIGMITHMGSLLGFRNLDRFRVQPQMIGPEALAQGQENGTVVPVGSSQGVSIQ